MTALPTVDLTGDWTLTVSFLRGSRTHRLWLQQTGNEVSGAQQSDGFSGTVSGQLTAARVQLTFSAPFEGVSIFYSFEGEAKDGTMDGVAYFGCTNSSNDGAVNRRGFGDGRFSAVRFG
jgi:hypothetical protein